MDWSQFKGAKLVLNANYKLIPVTLFDICERDAERWNEIYCFLKNSDYSKITRTPSGGISTDRRYFRPPMWDLATTKSYLELTVLNMEGMFRFQFRYDIKEEPQAMFGSKAIKLFASKLQKDTGIDLWDYKIDNGLEVRQTVPRYQIKANERVVKMSPDIASSQIFTNVHHIDFHSSFPAGLANAYPEFRPTIEFYYQHRNRVPAYKGLLNSLIGIMWSARFHNACFANLAKAAITDNNDRLEDLTQRLVESGRVPLLWNTDGLWYSGDIYHGEGEGKLLGMWENDHVDCKLRIKSVGAYEYVEDGKYTAVVRGKTTLDKFKPRALWGWGDIFGPQSNVITFYFDEEKGITYGEEYEL